MPRRQHPPLMAAPHFGVDLGLPYRQISVGSDSHWQDAHTTSAKYVDAGDGLVYDA